MTLVEPFSPLHPTIQKFITRTSKRGTALARRANILSRAAGRTPRRLCAFVDFGSIQPTFIAAVQNNGGGDRGQCFLYKRGKERLLSGCEQYSRKTGIKNREQKVETTKTGISEKTSNQRSAFSQGKGYRESSLQHSAISYTKQPKVKTDFHSERRYDY